MELEWKYLDELYREKYFDKDVPQVYLKSEADKVIANRDYEIEKLKESISNLLKMNTEQVMVEVMKKALIYGEGFVSVEHAMKMVSELRHHKYKRCLAMADACRGNFLVAEHMIEKEPKNLMWHKIHKHYGRWMMLWRCFAEEFKETK